MMFLIFTYVKLILSFASFDMCKIFQISAHLKSIFSFGNVALAVAVLIAISSICTLFCLNVFSLNFSNIFGFFIFAFLQNPQSTIDPQSTISSQFGATSSNDLIGCILRAVNLRHFSKYCGNCNICSYESLLVTVVSAWNSV